MGLLVCVTNPKCDSCIVKKQTKNKKKPTKTKSLAQISKWKSRDLYPNCLISGPTV